MKRKLQSSGRSEPLNLKRFRSELNQFSKDHSADWLQIQQGGGVREIVKPNKGLNRKQQRKEERRLKKMRKFAFKQKKPVSNNNNNYVNNLCGALNDYEVLYTENRRKRFVLLQV